MNVTVRFFAKASELAGTEEAVLQLPEQADVRQLKDRLGEVYPSLAPLIPHLFIAINEEYAKDADTLSEGARIACFPPVSGG